MNTSPAKIILFGEHAVVYGYPAIAVPFTSVSTTVTASAGEPGSGVLIRAHDMGQEYRVVRDNETFGGPLAFAVQVLLAELKASLPDLIFDIHSTIPVGGGFGSGAAVTAALMRELAAALGYPIDAARLNALVYEVEKLFHGNPSGIDNTTIVYERPVYFVRGQPPQPFQIGARFQLIIADSGIAGSTMQTIEDVRRFREANPVAAGPLFERIGMLVDAARSHIEAGTPELLGGLMTENHGLLRALTVSSALLDRLVTVALQAGALGAKLSGGGRGGNVIALASADDLLNVTAALRGAGAVHTWVTTVQ